MTLFRLYVKKKIFVYLYNISKICLPWRIIICIFSMVLVKLFSQKKKKNSHFLCMMLVRLFAQKDNYDTGKKLWNPYKALMVLGASVGIYASF